MAVERIAHQACYNRLVLDLASEDERVLFLQVPLDGARLANVDGPEVQDLIDHMYRKILARNPTERESDIVRDLYREFEAEPLGLSPAASWAQLACFMLVTSTEFLFY